MATRPVTECGATAAVDDSAHCPPLPPVEREEIDPRCFPFLFGPRTWSLATLGTGGLAGLLWLLGGPGAPLCCGFSLLALTARNVTANAVGLAQDNAATRQTLIQAIEALRTERDALEKTNHSLQEKIESLQTETDRLKGQVDAFQNGNMTLANSLTIMAEMQRQYATSLQLLQNTQAAYAANCAELQKVQRELAEATTRLQGLHLTQPAAQTPQDPLVLITNGTN